MIRENQHIAIFSDESFDEYCDGVYNKILVEDMEKDKKIVKLCEFFLYRVMFRGEAAISSVVKLVCEEPLKTPLSVPSYVLFNKLDEFKNDPYKGYDLYLVIKHSDNNDEKIPLVTASDFTQYMGVVKQVFDQLC